MSQDWAGKKQALDWDQMETALVDSAVPNVVFVDCTASGVVGEMYEGWLRSGYHVITPNKKAGSGTPDWIPPTSNPSIERVVQRPAELCLFESRAITPHAAET